MDQLPTRRAAPGPPQGRTPGACAAGAERCRLDNVHFHDLRRTGNALTADAGANLRELMERMGHGSTRAALIYLHSTSERQRTIADAVGKPAKAALRKAKTPKTTKAGDTASGTKVARRRGEAS